MSPASDEPAAVKSGAWLLSELGYRAAPLIGEITSLLDLPLRYVRFFAVDAVLSCATSADGTSVAKVDAMIADSDEAVRWKVLRFLGPATTDQLLAGARCSASTPLASLTTWLADDGSDATRAEEVLKELEAADRLTSLFAVAAAARLAGTTLRPLERAVGSADAEIRSFAEEELQLLRRRSR